MKSLTLDAKLQLDQFLQQNYNRLLDYAIHQERDEEKGNDILQDVIVRLYEGRDFIDFEKSPMTWIQYLIRRRRGILFYNRQVQFENGFQVKGRALIRDVIRVPFEEVENHADKAFDETLFDRSKQMEVYVEIKAALSERQRWIIEHMEQGMNGKTMYPLFCQTWESKFKYHNFRSEVARTLRIIKTKIQARFPNAS